MWGFHFQRRSRYRAATLIALVSVAIGNAGAAIIYVDQNRPGTGAGDGSSWATAFKTVTDGVAATQAGDELWVAKGTYLEQITLKAGVKLYGGFNATETLLSARDWKLNRSILDGQGAGTVVTVEAGADENTRVDGLVIQNGAGEAGGGIQSIAASPVIANNWIHDNVATNGGGGIYIADCSALVVSNRIEGNNVLMEFATAGGGICSSNCSSLITGNVIARNTAFFGGGIRCWEGTQTIRNNVIAGNQARQLAGGIEVAMASVLIEGNRIAGNVALYGSEGAGGGVSVVGSEETTLRNNLMIANSTSGNGGAIYASTGPGSQLNLINNTIIDNYGRSRTSGVPEHWGPSLYIEGSEVVGVNNIIAFGSGGVWIGAGAEWRNNCVYGGSGPNYSGGMTDPTGMDGNISVDPEIGFSRDSAEFHLQPGSPCIDAGSSVGIDLGLTDIDGENRVVGTAVDIGADELDGTPKVFEPGLVRVSTTGDDANDGSSWSTAKKTIQAALDQAVTAGGEVWVAGGSYAAPVFMKPMVKLFGGFAGNEIARSERNPNLNTTIIDGGRMTNVVRAEYLDDVAEINGFVIQNGLEVTGGGLKLMRAPINVVSNLFRANGSKDGSTGPTGGPANSGGALDVESSDAWIVGNRFQENYSLLGSVYVRSGLPWIQRNLFLANVSTNQGYPSPSGSGIVVASAGTVVANNSFIDNTVHTGNSYSQKVGIGVLANQPCEIVNNTFFGNSSDFLNSTLPPTSTPNQAAVFLAADGCVIANNIFDRNTYAIITASNPTQSISNNCFHGQLIADVKGLPDPTVDAGNLFADPQLAGRYSLLHLAEASPCRNAGSNDFVDPRWLDIDGAARIEENLVDIGADEFSGQVPVEEPRVFHVREDGDDDADGGSWTTAKRTIQAGIDAAFAGGGAEVWVARGHYLERPHVKAFTYLHGGFAGTETTQMGRDFLANQTLIDGEYLGTAVSVDAPGPFSSVDGFTIVRGRGFLAGGIYCGPRSSPLIANNRIFNCATDNSVNGTSSGMAGRYRGGGGIRGEYASPIIINNTIASNTAPTMIVFAQIHGGGAAISLDGGVGSVVDNNTIVRNFGWEYTGVLSGLAAEIRNNIFAQGSGGIVTPTGSTPTIENNCFFGNVTNDMVGDFALLADPQFVDDQATFFLSGSSPCIDAGLDSVVQPDWTDVYGRPRISGSAVDLGAVEMQPDDTVLPVTHVPAFSIEVVGGVAYLKYERTVDGDYTGDLMPAPYLDGDTIRWDFQLSLDVNSSSPGSSFAGTIPLGTPAPGTYQFQPSSWGVPLATTQFVIPPDGPGTMTNPALTLDGFQFTLNGVDNVRYITDQTADFQSWQTVATSDDVGQPVMIPANQLTGRDFFRVRMESREVSVP